MHRPTVIALSAAAIVAAVLIYPTLSTEFSTQTDEGQVQVNIELARGTRIEVTGPVLDRVEQMVRELVPEATDMIVNAGSGGGGFGGPGFGPGGGNRGNIQLILTPKDERPRSSDPAMRAGLRGVSQRCARAARSMATSLLPGTPAIETSRCGSESDALSSSTSTQVCPAGRE